MLFLAVPVKDILPLSLDKNVVYNAMGHCLFTISYSEYPKYRRTNILYFLLIFYLNLINFVVYNYNMIHLCFSKILFSIFWRYNARCFTRSGVSRHANINYIDTFVYITVITCVVRLLKRFRLLETYRRST